MFELLNNHPILHIRLCGGKVFNEESCMLACPMDCHMSPWSDWGLCDTVCGSGLKNRTSKVIVIHRNTLEYKGIHRYTEK